MVLPLNVWTLFALRKRMNRSYSLNKNMAKTVIYLFYYHSLTLKTISFKTLKISVEKNLKNHYIISGKTSIKDGKNTYENQICNQKRIR